MFKPFYPIIALLMFCSGLCAQSFNCGTTGELAEPIAERLKLHKLAIENHEIVHPRSTVYVALKFHLVGKDDGTGRIGEGKILTQICTLNEDFADQNIQFYIDDSFNYINDTQTFNDHEDTQFSIMVDNKDLNAVNIYVIESIDPNSLIQAYYRRSLDWIVINNDQIGTNHTLTHEIGHYLGLLHPFHGWDRDPYDQNKHGVPAPSFIRGVEVEKADGSNCETAGDMICDTPADYAYQYPRNNCEFDDTILDPCNKPINPDEKLFMNYFKCARNEYYFTGQQKEVILAELMSSNRFSIRDKAPNSTASISQSPSIISPQNNETITTNSVSLAWSVVQNATHYLVELDQIPNFGSDKRVSVIVNEASAFVSGLDPNRLYFWRVTPFNEYYTCQEVSQRAAFKTGLVTGTNYIESVNNWLIAPNPMQRDLPIKIQLSTSETFTASVMVHNLSGQKIQDFGHKLFREGDNNLSLKFNSNLTAGVYLLSVNSAKGKLLEKIIFK